MYAQVSFDIVCSIFSACVSGIPCPLPLVAPFEVEQADGAVYAQGPFSVYVKGKMRYSRVMVKKARTDVAEETQFKLFENEAMVLRSAIACCAWRNIFLHVVIERVVIMNLSYAACTCLIHDNKRE